MNRDARPDGGVTGSPADAAVGFQLMLVTDRHATLGRDLVDVVAAACRGGVDAVQLRDKDLSRSARAALLERLRLHLPAGVRLIVNTDLELAKATRCGLHLPAGVAWPAGERPHPTGCSVHGEQETKNALDEQPDYILFGHVYDTPSHPHEPGRGVAALRAVVVLAGAVPVIAIGGIESHRVAELRSTGVAGVAVRRTLLEASDPERAARALRAAWDGR